jgi:hypothetical protein
MTPDYRIVEAELKHVADLPSIELAAAALLVAHAPPPFSRKLSASNA